MSASEATRAKALELIERVDADGRARIEVARRQNPIELACTLIGISRVADEALRLRPEIMLAVERGSRMGKPTAEWVFIFWLEDRVPDFEGGGS